MSARSVGPTCPYCESPVNRKCCLLTKVTIHNHKVNLIDRPTLEIIAQCKGSAGLFVATVQHVKIARRRLRALGRSVQHVKTCLFDSYYNHGNSVVIGMTHHHTLTFGRSVAAGETVIELPCRFYVTLHRCKVA